jgi:hypothetical protein
MMKMDQPNPNGGSVVNDVYGTRPYPWNLISVLAILPMTDARECFCAIC